MKLKKILRYILPKKARTFLSHIIPRFYIVNTYLLSNPGLIENLHLINKKYRIKTVSWQDEEKLKKAHLFRGPDSYKSKIPARLNSEEWTGLAIFDKTNGDIAYLAWIINKSIPYFEEFGIYLKDGQFLLKDGYCIPAYRHKGLHTRMEQERINYCVRQGAKDIFIQIHNSNIKGVASVLANEYLLYSKNYVLQWHVFNVYRNLSSFLKNPFKKIVK